MTTTAATVRETATLRETGPRSPRIDEEPPLAEIVETLRLRLVQGEALPPERALAADLGITRHLLRQILQRLRQTGELPPAKVGRRAKLADPPAENMIRRTNPLEVIELRLVFEPSLARLAAVRASPAEIDEILRRATTGPDEDYGQADVAFHRALAAAAHNRLAAEVYALLRTVAHDPRVALALRPAACLATRRKQRDAEHMAVAKAIEARNPDGAAEAMRRHLAAVQRQVVDRLVPGDPALTSERTATSAGEEPLP